MQNPEFFKGLVAAGYLGETEMAALRLRHRNDAHAALLDLVKESPERKLELAKIWSDGLGVALVELGKTLIQDTLVAKFPRTFAETRHMIPLYKLGSAVTVACADPLDQAALVEAAHHLGAPVSPVFGWPEDIQAAIEIHYQSGDAIMEMVRKVTEKPFFKEGQETITEDALRHHAGDQAVVAFTQGLLLLAAKERASDIHIEPAEQAVRVRFRIDGVLRERLTLATAVHMPLVSRLKILSNLDIMEKRKPQDGRIALPLPGRSLDFRLSTVPTLYGEKVVLRVLGQLRSTGVPALSEMSFAASNLRLLKRLLEYPNGVLLVTGPTGSGKSTSLYAMLRHLNQPGINIMTVEDPVEYRLAGLNQIQVNPVVDLDFATALRAFLRQDPDVILVGEIRDKETARIALQAALTGHLVLSTLHTNSAVQAVTRLVDIGVEPFLVAPAILGAMAQRLVRRICPACREAYTPDAALLDSLFARDGSEAVAFYRGKGCVECGGSGYKGRLGIHEFFVLGPNLRTQVAQGATAMQLLDTARQEGFRSMRYDGLKKVLRGLTTLEEVNRVAPED